MESELNRIDKRIFELHEELMKLRNRRRTITGPVYYKDPNVDILVNFVGKNPGCDRAAIEQALPDLTRQELSNLLTKVRKIRGLIENRGSKSHPSWYATSANEGL